MLRARAVSSKEPETALPISTKTKSSKESRRKRLTQKRRIRWLFQNQGAVIAMFLFVLLISCTSVFFMSRTRISNNENESHPDHGHHRHLGEEPHHHHHKKRHHYNGHKHRTLARGEEEEDEGCNMASVRHSEADGLAQCRNVYESTKTLEPEEGWLKEIDFYNYRGDHIFHMRTHCYMRCLDFLIDRDGEGEIDEYWLIEAATLGLPRVANRLLHMGLDPLFHPPAGGLNAIQAAIRGGYAEVVKILTGSNYEMAIDKYGRNVKDYINLKGSPIRPVDAREILGIDVHYSRDHEPKASYSYNDAHSGWSKESELPFDDTKCDIDVLTNLSRDDFFRDYYLPGRPLVIKNFVPQPELDAFSKDRWDSTEDYNIHRRRWRVGPTAYPSLTDQEHCEQRMSIEEVEASKECKEMPGIPMEVAWHPDEEEFEDLWPMYEGEDLYSKSGWRNMEAWFGPRGDYGHHLAWQVFFGGDGSGATLHWHGPAFNNLYVGTKQWRITPPKYRGFTGMPARDAQEYLDDVEKDLVMGCVQHAGDMMYIPENWGHSTLTHAFTIGAAVILPEPYHQPRDVAFLFVHINKTGGTSIIERFRRSCPSDFLSEEWGEEHRTFHTTAHSFINHYGRTVWDNAYTFTVVRHPLARQVSNFFFLASTCHHNPEVCRARIIPERVRGPRMFELSEEQKIEAFHEWTWALYQKYPPGSEEQYYFGSKTVGNQENKSFNATQTSWLVDENDRIVVKDIIKLEQLDESMDRLTENIPCLKSSNPSAESRHLEKHDKGVEFGHTNVTPKYPDWKLFAKNERTRRIIEEVFKVDFVNFGYTMPE